MFEDYIKKSMKLDELSVQSSATKLNEDYHYEISVDGNNIDSYGGFNTERDAIEAASKVIKYDLQDMLRDEWDITEPFKDDDVEIEIYNYSELRNEYDNYSCLSLAELEKKLDALNKEWDDLRANLTGNPAVDIYNVGVWDYIDEDNVYYGCRLKDANSYVHDNTLIIEWVAQEEIDVYDIVAEIKRAIKVIKQHLGIKDKVTVLIKMCTRDEWGQWIKRRITV